MNNVYCEIGSAFGSLAIEHPEMCMHLIGKNIKHYGVDHVLWGTDCLWWGSPQWVIDADQAVPDHRRAVREVRLQEADQGRQGEDLRPQRGQDLRRRREGEAQCTAQGRAEQAEDGLPGSAAACATTPPTAGCGPMRDARFAAGIWIALCALAFFVQFSRRVYSEDPEAPRPRGVGERPRRQAGPRVRHRRRVPVLPPERSARRGARTATT